MSDDAPSIYNAFTEVFGEDRLHGSCAMHKLKNLLLLVSHDNKKEFRKDFNVLARQFINNIR